MKKKDANIYEVVNVPYFVKSLFCTIFCCHVLLLYGCETWSLILREERRLRVFENRVLRRVFGPKRDEVTGMEKAA